MKRTFVSYTINKEVRVWSVERFDNVNATSVEYHFLNSPNIETKITEENNTAFNKRIKDKLKSGYVEVTGKQLGERLCKDILDASIEAVEFKAPMKCQKYDPVKFAYPCLGQPKLNGFRCYIVWGTWINKNGIFTNTFEGPIALSQEGCRYHVPHITQCFVKSDFCKNDSDEPTLYYDGELYVYGEKLNIIKRRIPIEINGIVSNPSLPTEPVNFWCFDIAEEETTYNVRSQLRINKVSHVTINDVVVPIKGYMIVKIASRIPIVLVHDTHITNVEKAQEFTNNCINNGFEGSVLRTYDNEYKYGKRPQDILKIKRYEDGEFQVVDVIAKPKGDGCMFVCKNDINDCTFECVPEGDFDLQAKWLESKELLIGKMVTIKYYERSGVKKCPFHANVIDIRLFR